MEMTRFELESRRNEMAVHIQNAIAARSEEELWDWANRLFEQLAPEDPQAAFGEWLLMSLAVHSLTGEILRRVEVRELEGT